VSIGGLPAGTYEVYATGFNSNKSISDGAQQGFWAVATDTNATSINTSALGSSTVSVNDLSTSWVDGRNYVKLTVLISEGQNLTIISTGTSAVETRGFLNSIQIVPVPTVLLFDFGPTTVTGGDVTNSPYDCSSIGTSWNKAQNSNITNGLVYANGIAASGVSLKLGRSSTATGWTNFVYTTSSIASAALGTGANTGIYSGTSVGKDAINFGTVGNYSVTGVSIGGLPSGLYEIYAIGFNSNKSISDGAQAGFWAVATETNATSINTSALGSSAVSSNNLSTSWVEGRNYVKLSVVLGEGQNLTVISTGTSAAETRGFLNSIQIVSVPERVSIGQRVGETDGYSLYLGPDGETLAGYYPMGFVRGGGLRAVQEGYNQVQELSLSAGFVEGNSYPLPCPAREAGNLRWYSMALGADAVSSKLVSSASTGALSRVTLGYGPLSISIGPDGNPRTTGKDTLDVFDPATKQYLTDYAREHVQSRTNSPLNPAIVRWGLDNEWEGAPNYSAAARTNFAAWLQEAYTGSVAALNEAWNTNGLTFVTGSQVTLPAPTNYTANPGLFLDWWAFQADHFMDVLADQAQAMYETDPLHRGVVHKSTQVTIEMPAMNRPRVFDHAKFADLIRPYSGGLYGIDLYGNGDRAAYELNYIFNCIRPADRQAGSGVMLCEYNNHDGPGHQYGSTSWRFLANGLKALNNFTMGFAGATGDFHTYSFLDSSTGGFKEKLFYAADWAAMVHRSEKFWTESVPAPGMPRIAMLMPRRDVLLSDVSSRTLTTVFAYPRNHRWMVFRWLREQGYWVDVIPYTKLTEAYLEDYQAVVLVGALHLSEDECDVVRDYVQGGGVLLADTRPGYFDQHHRIRDSLSSELGVTATALAELRDISFTYGGRTILGKQTFSVQTNSEVVATADNGEPLAFLHEEGSGKVLYLPFELGTLTDQASFTSNSLMPGNEYYAGFSGEFAIGDWLGSLLSGSAGVYPAYSASTNRGKLRVEQPYVDNAGNCAVIVANRALAPTNSLVPEILPPSSVSLPLPGGPWTHALWASAECAEIQKIPVSLVNDQYEINLPEINSAAVLTFFHEHPPLLGVALNDNSFHPGETFSVRVRLFNTTGATLPAGSLEIQLPADWSAQFGRVGTTALAPDQSAEWTFQVTPPADGDRLFPEWLYPITFRWNEGGGSMAVATVHVVERDADPSTALHLLSDNAYYPSTYLYRTSTGASYSYLYPSIGAGAALTNGFGNIGGDRNSNYRGVPLSAYFASYNSTNANILFDLKAERDVRKVVLVRGPEGNSPVRISVLTSTDGADFSPQCEIPVSGSGWELTSPHFRAQARYLQIQVEWAAPGGTLDEVELWGY
jgi:hypothetical protein